MNNKCTLLIDGNWLLQSRFSVLGKNFKTDQPTRIKEKGASDLTDLMAKSINVMLNRFKSIDNVILVSDGGSWRKSVEKPNTRKDVIYKGNRESSEEYDWKFIWSALKTLSTNFVKNNITYSYATDIEGDDWIWYWSTILNQRGINCIIWSSDNDLKQLVNKDNSTGAFTMWYNDRNGGFLHDCFNDSEEDILEAFMKPMYFNSSLDSVKAALGKKLSYVNPNSIILSKIICGDAGDNIKPVAVYENKSRLYKFTERMWDDVVSMHNIYSISDLIDHEDDVAAMILSNKKFSDLDKSAIVENIKYNTKLVWLNSHSIPQHIINVMSKCEYKLADMNYIKCNYKTLCNIDKDIEKNIDEIEDLFD